MLASPASVSRSCARSDLSSDAAGLRGAVGLGRLAAYEGNGSGDIFIAFSTANPDADDGNWEADPSKPAAISGLTSEAMNPVLEATVQSVEEAVVNAMVAARTKTGADYWTVSAMPHDQRQQVLRAHGMRVPPAR